MTFNRTGAAMARASVSLAALGLLAVGNGSSARAADLGGAPSPPPQYGYASPLDTARWTGAYLGIAYGYSDGITAATGGSGNFDLDQNGGIGSLYGGYNWQFGRIVTGLEAEAGIGRYDGSKGAGAALVSSELNTLMAVRGRVGYLVSPSFLVYGTGGFAAADMDFKANTISKSDWVSGYQLGAGTELNVAGPWTLRLEYLYTDLGSQTLTHGGISNTYEPDFHTVRAGVSLKF